MRDRPDKTKLLNRLSRVEGHVRGIAKMVEADRYCIDILTQISAARAALAKVETELLKTHLSCCIEGAIVSGDAEDQRTKARELIDLLQRSLK
jgi:DNA-binding FrmR family transcriptional regulator